MIQIFLKSWFESCKQEYGLAGYIPCFFVLKPADLPTQIPSPRRLPKRPLYQIRNCLKLFGFDSRCSSVSYQTSPKPLYLTLLYSFTYFSLCRQSTGIILVVCPEKHLRIVLCVAGILFSISPVMTPCILAYKPAVVFIQPILAVVPANMKY